MNLPKKVEESLNSTGFQETTTQIVAGDGFVKQLFTLIASAAVDPSGISAVSTLAGLLSNLGDSLLHQRELAFFEELKKNPNKLSEGVIKSQEFVHKFLITYRAVIMTNRTEKIKCLANLLKSSTVLSNGIEVDEYEEYLRIINDLSYRELSILSIIDKNLTSLPKPPKPFDKHIKDTTKLWEGRFYGQVRQELAETLGVRRQEMDDILIRLSRSGLYKQKDYIAGANGNGLLTPLYYRIKELILL